MTDVSSKTCNIIPSLFAADPLHYFDALKAVEQAGLNRIHLDIMDGHFVPNISFGSNVVASVVKATPTLLCDVHLMVCEPQRWIEPFVKNGAKRLFIHIELVSDVLKETVRRLQSENIEWGFAVNPETSIDILQTYREVILRTRLLLLMSVHPGFCGQTFIENTFERVKEVRTRFPHLKICTDGGIRKQEARQLQALGVESVVMGSAFFKD